ncbi:MAG: hypothetical protein V1690_02050 [Candidatus Moraniibacteriota bacterium]
MITVLIVLVVLLVVSVVALIFNCGFYKCNSCGYRFTTVSPTAGELNFLPPGSGTKTLWRQGTCWNPCCNNRNFWVSEEESDQT